MTPTSGCAVNRRTVQRDLNLHAMQRLEEIYAVDADFVNVIMR
jgi:hypothetical protein